MGTKERFLQRLDSYRKAYSRLKELVEVIKGKSSYSVFSDEEIPFEEEIVREALIKRFEFTQELSWNVLKDYLQYQGEMDMGGSRDVYRRALKYGLIENDEWMKMILDRNLSAHDYNDMKSKIIAERIVNDYFPLLSELLSTMERKGAE